MSRHTRVDHAKAAARLMQAPGQWLPVGEYRNSFTASTTASMIRRPGQTNPSGRHYQPAGAYDARIVLTDDGARIEARYRGADLAPLVPARPRGGRQVRPSSDAERVLGQIERGEVRAGADAAREIAARAEAAYGDVWKPNTVRGLPTAQASTTAEVEAA
ncbi:hypothetical protein DCW30_05620 [Streptomyces alfalfae]|uniref:Uncharacterized protein n=1 Tax=Streptomyces alfalfae TaxID=1642299 RepID=A0ABM6GVZ6_9ACTN|nr:hypothetical protein [Streptomyces alfalfae]APY88220.1 hypothetical protein A7J05_23255 [Streptomyces alfalfae]AYA18615.1 hypothetical protein D3X13_22365 [Streptomyces fradiae]RXX46505.1 hypothetical protein DCW30_05620 [Streptomyces alfalfae]RZM90018.1 hypothetical protein D4104_25555 [Streptomyces alfalfae]